MNERECHSTMEYNCVLNCMKQNCYHLACKPDNFTKRKKFVLSEP